MGNYYYQIILGNSKITKISTKHPYLIGSCANNTYKLLPLLQHFFILLLEAKNYFTRRYLQICTLIKILFTNQT